MHNLSFLVGLGAVVSCWTPLASAVVPTWFPVLAERAAGSLDNFIASERPRALEGVLENIGAGGSKVSGAGPGVVVASPSKEDPNCTSLNCSLSSPTTHCVSISLYTRKGIVHHTNFHNDISLVAHLVGFLLSEQE